MAGDRGISKQTTAALLEVIAEDRPGLFYAWKIQDGDDGRVWLTLSRGEAESWQARSDVRVTIVGWDVPDVETSST